MWDSLAALTRVRRENKEDINITEYKIILRSHSENMFRLAAAANAAGVEEYNRNAHSRQFMLECRE